MKKIKISQLPLFSSHQGLYTIGSDSDNRSVKVPLDPLGRIKPDLVKVTWAQLKALRDASGLVPGCWYRITDYTCTTTQEETQSAGNVYDILVLATDTGSLSEQARAIRHEGDTYFAKSNLDAWQVWYCLDNDAHRFLWADTTNGKGVVYRLIDEYGNDCPYDFKNIMFKRYKNFSYEPQAGNYLYGVLDSTYFPPEVTDPYSTFCYTFNLPELILDQAMLNEYVAQEDMRGELNVLNYSGGLSDITEAANYNNPVDASLNNKWTYDRPTYDGLCRNNVIAPYRQPVYFDNVCYNVAVLNNIVMHSDYDIGEHSEDNDYTTGSATVISQRNNKFSGNCHNITFGQNCNRNTLGEGCYDIGFFANVSYNSVGDNSRQITIDCNTQFNTIGGNCRDIYINSNVDSRKNERGFNRVQDDVLNVFVRGEYNVLEADCHAIDVDGSHNVFREKCSCLCMLGSNCVIHTGTKGTSEFSPTTLSRTSGDYEINYSMDPDGNIIQWTT